MHTVYFPLPAHNYASLVSFISSTFAASFKREALFFDFRKKKEAKKKINYMVVHKVVRTAYA